MEPSPKTADLLAVRANVARSRLGAALEALERRRREALDIRLQVSQHIGLLRVAAVIGVTGILAIAAYRAATASRRRLGPARWRMLRRVWNHPELAAEPRESLAGKIVRAVLVGAARFCVARLLEQSGPVSAVGSPLAPADGVGAIGTERP
jgi:hypothetical protein